MSLAQIAESPSIQIVRLEGGWIVTLPHDENSINKLCRTPRDVIGVVMTFVSYEKKLPLFEGSGGNGHTEKAAMILNKVDGGFLLADVRPPNPRQHLRWSPREVVTFAVEWLGLSATDPGAEAAPLDEGLDDEPDEVSLFWLEPGDGDEGTFDLLFPDNSPIQFSDRVRLARAIGGVMNAPTVVPHGQDEIQLRPPATHDPHADPRPLDSDPVDPDADSGGDGGAAGGSTPGE